MPRPASRKIQWISDNITNELMGNATHAPANALYLSIDSAEHWNKDYPNVCYCDKCGVVMGVTNKRGKESVYLCADDVLANRRKSTNPFARSETPTEAATEAPTEAATAPNGRRPRRDISITAPAEPAEVVTVE